MKIEDMTPGQKEEAIGYISDGMSKEEAIAKVTGEEFTAEVEEIDTRPVNEEVVEVVGEVMPFDAREAPTETPKVQYVAVKQDQHKLTIDEIKKHICSNATDQEAYAFLQLCNARRLNPFTKEAYLMKYGSNAATIVVGKDAFTRRAEEHPMFDGFEAGIILQTEEGIERRPGTFKLKDEVLVGGWAKVHRKDRSVPFLNEVSMTEYNTGKSSWSKIPSTMIRKVALVQSLREAFPSDLGGCYDSSEMGEDAQ